MQLRSNRLAIIGANHQDALASWITDAAEPVREEPLICQQAHCDDTQEIDSVFCWRHAPVCAF